jgi:hypothetical protein
MLAMSNDEIRKVAPSVFATEPWNKVSERYAFIPTSTIVEKMRKSGLVPVRAMQSKTRIPGKGDFTRHMLRFRQRKDLDVGLHQEIPEIVLVNSHDRSSSYKLSAGVFRMVCTNGMVIRTSNFGDIHVHHSGNIVDKVLEGSSNIISDMPSIMQQVEALKAVRMGPQQRLAYAQAALELRWPSTEDGKATSPITAESLLHVRREEDKRPSVWTVFNVVQENFMRGGLSGRGSTGRRLTTRAINSVGEEMRLNKALWLLTEKMAKLLG